MSSLLDFRVCAPLNGFELDVAVDTDARSLGLFGPSGAGKTSVLECLAGWRRPREGHAHLGGRQLFDLSRRHWLPKRERGIGYVPQDVLLFPHWTVLENVTAGVRGRAARSEESSLERVSDVLDLGALLERSVVSLSGGEQQRVALARALCSSPDLLLLDEPLGALDLPLRRRILPYLIRVHEEFDVPMIVVSHDPTEVKALCDEVAVIDRGVVVEQGRPSSVLTGSGRDSDPLAGLENVLAGRVLGCDEGIARIGLAGGVEVCLPRGGFEPGERAIFGVRARDILISTEVPAHLSARNILAARVESLVEHGDDVLFAIRLSGEEGAGEVLHVELTVNAARELGLEPGTRVYLIIKAHACSVLSVVEQGEK